MTATALGSLSLFQLQNLVENRVPFLLFKIDWPEKEELTGLPPSVERFIKTGRQVKLNEMDQVVEQEVPRLEQPVVLLSRDGDHCQSLAERLEKKGYLNIYVVKEGLQGLKSQGDANE